MRKGRSGLPLYEIALVVVLAGLILWGLQSRVEYLLEQAERVAMETTLMNVRSALRLETARRIAAGQALGGMDALNPLEALASPANSAPLASGLVKTGHWRWISDKKSLIYQPQRRRHLKVQAPAADNPIVWQLKSGAAGQVEIALVTPYEWF